MIRVNMTIALIIFSLTCHGQRYFSRAGEVSFHSATPLENIDAHTKQATCIIDFSTGEIIFAVLMKSFQFKKALMEEHFNENYVESSKYPKATFSGKLVDPKAVQLKKEGIYNVEVEGKMKIHGVEKPVKTKGTIEVKKDKLIVKSSFSVVPEEYNIQIPSLVRDKIAKSISVQLESVCNPYKK